MANNNIASKLTSGNPAEVLAGIRSAIEAYGKLTAAPSNLNGRTFQAAFERGRISGSTPETPTAGA